MRRDAQSQEMLSVLQHTSERYRFTPRRILVTSGRSRSATRGLCRDGRRMVTKGVRVPSNQS